MMSGQGELLRHAWAGRAASVVTARATMMMALRIGPTNLERRNQCAYSREFSSRNRALAPAQTDDLAARDVDDDRRHLRRITAHAEPKDRVVVGCELDAVHAGAAVRHRTDRALEASRFALLIVGVH